MNQQLKVCAELSIRLSVVVGSDSSLFTLHSSLSSYGESNEGRMADALAHGGDEGRDKLR